MSPKLLLDEHISPTIAHRLSDLGFDVTGVRDRGLLGLQDWDLMTWCGTEGRAICTRNEDDFEAEHDKYIARGGMHYGIVVVRGWSTEQIFIALKTFLESTDDVDLLNQLVKLEEP